MARRVYLHIGTMKSATTYLQQLGDHNRSRLAAAGVLWPEWELPFLALGDLLGRDGQRPGQSGAWTELVQQFREHPGDAVFSNELLAPINSHKLEQLVGGLSPAEVEVIVTARDLARVIPSHWQTTLKNGSTTTWPEFAAAVCAVPRQQANVARTKDTGSWFWRRHDIPAILQRWGEVVPPEQMSVVTVPPTGADPDLVAQRFASVLGIDAGRFERPEYANSSVGAHSAELLRRLNAVAPDLERHHYRWGMKEGVAKLALIDRAEQEPPFGLTAEEHDWVRRRAEQMIEEIRRSPVRVVGDLGDLRPSSDVRPGLADPSESSAADLLDAALVGLGEMVKAVSDEKLERKRQRVDTDA